jgi:ferrous iron transport protein A
MIDFLPRNRLKAQSNNGIESLADLQVGQEALVIQIKDPQLKLALLRLGILEGDKVTLTERAPMGGPMAFRVRGGKVAMRKADAARVFIKALA